MKPNYKTWFKRAGPFVSCFWRALTKVKVHMVQEKGYQPLLSVLLAFIQNHIDAANPSFAGNL